MVHTLCVRCADSGPGRLPIKRNIRTLSELVDYPWTMAGIISLSMPSDMYGSVPISETHPNDFRIWVVGSLATFGHYVSNLTPAKEWHNWTFRFPLFHSAAFRLGHAILQPQLLERFGERDFEKSSQSMGGEAGQKGAGCICFGRGLARNPGPGSGSVWSANAFHRQTGQGIVGEEGEGE